MKYLSRIFVICTLAIFLISSNAYANAIPPQYYTEILVINDGVRVNFPDQKPYIDANSRTLVPVRFVSETLGANVGWENATRTVGISSSKYNIFLQIGQKFYTKNGQKVAMDTAAVITNSRTMVPVRFISEALGANVKWEAVGSKGVVFNFTKGQSEAEMQKSITSIVGEVKTEILVAKAKTELAKLPTYTTDLNKGLSFNGVGYTVEDAASFAYNFLVARTNYDGTNGATMNVWEKDVASYYTKANQAGLTTAKNGIIADKEKASSIVYVDATKIQIKNGNFYINTLVVNTTNNSVWKAEVIIGGHEINKDQLAVGYLNWTAVK